MIEQIARALFEKGAADRVIAAVMTKDRAHMHLDTVFTLLDRDKATAYSAGRRGHPGDQPPPGLEARDARRPRGQGPPVGRRPTRWASRSCTVVATGGDAYQQEREQWDDGNNVVALEPGVVVAYERNTFTISKMREAGVEVVDDRRLRARQGPRRRALHDLPDRPRSDLREAAVNEQARSVVGVIAVIAIVLLLLLARGAGERGVPESSPTAAAPAAVVIG